MKKIDSWLTKHGLKNRLTLVVIVIFIIFLILLFIEYKLMLINYDRGNNKQECVKKWKYSASI